MEKKGGGVSHFSVKNFWSKCQKFSYGNPLVRHYFRVSKTLCLRGLCNDFMSNFFCLTVPKKVCCNTSVSENFGHRKNFLRREDHDFLSTIFCLTVPKKIVGTIRCIGKLRVSKKLFAKGDHYFLSTIYGLAGPKNFVREPLCFRKFLI